MKNVDEIFETYRKEKKEIEFSVEQIKKDIGNMIDKIVLYGAGSAGIAFLMYLRDAGIYPQYFADGNKSRWNEKCEGLEIIPPQEIVNLLGDNSLVIVTINTDGRNYCKSFPEQLRKGGPHAVYKKLSEYGCKNIIDYTFFRHCFALFRHEKYNLPSCSDVVEMENHIDNIKNIFQYMSDDISKRTFLDILKFRLIDDSIQIKTFEQRMEYFDYDIYKKIENEIFIDCGAFSGTTLDIFLENNRNMFNHFWAIEPDPQNYRKLLEHCDKLPREVADKITCKESAVYDESDRIISFYSLNSPGSFICSAGNTKVTTVSIDQMLAGQEATFIKMNIEGSEIPALRGAKKTIQNYKPVLAIMGYHKTSDFWEIPRIIKEILPEYKLYLRSYMNHISFVYYAVPQERLKN